MTYDEWKLETPPCYDITPEEEAELDGSADYERWLNETAEWEINRD